MNIPGPRPLLLILLLCGLSFYSLLTSRGALDYSVQSIDDGGVGPFTTATAMMWRALEDGGDTLPSSDEMPEEIRDAYHRLDTLLHRVDAEEIVRKVGSMEAGTGMLSRLALDLYAINDYDPVRFAEYADITEQIDHYTITARRLAETLYHSIRRGSSRRGNAFHSLLHADYILRVRVLAVEGERSGDERFCVAAEVIDTLKGRVLPAVPSVKRAPRDRPVIRFGYAPGNYLDPEELSRDRDAVDFPYARTDPAFTTSDARFTMREGQDAIVFLRHDELRARRPGCPLRLEPWASYNALPIIDDHVRDVNNVWSDDTMLHYTEWRSRFMGLRRGIR